MYNFHLRKRVLTAFLFTFLFSVPGTCSKCTYWLIDNNRTSNNFIKYYVVGFDPLSSSRSLGFMAVSLRIFAKVIHKFGQLAIHMLIQLTARLVYFNTRELPSGWCQPFELYPFIKVEFTLPCDHSTHISLVCLYDIKIDIKWFFEFWKEKKN